MGTIQSRQSRQYLYEEEVQQVVVRKQTVKEYVAHVSFDRRFQNFDCATTHVCFYINKQYNFVFFLNGKFSSKLCISYYKFGKITVLIYNAYFFLLQFT